MRYFEAKKCFSPSNDALNERIADGHYIISKSIDVT